MTFAEKIVESLVDENGYCGERGLSNKQFGILSKYLEEGSCQDIGGWEGTRGGYIQFWQQEYVGKIGRFEVKLLETKHFNFSHGVIEINAFMSKEDWDKKVAEKEAKKKAIQEMYKNSQWVGEIKQRLEFNVEVLRISEFEGYYGIGHRFEFVDEDGNIFVWFTNSEQEIEEGSKIRIRATIKDHSEWKGCKQNIVNRVNVR